MQSGARAVGVLCALLVLGQPAPAQGRWQTFGRGGDTQCLAATADGGALWAGSSVGIRIFELRGGNVRVREMGAEHSLPGRSVTALLFEPDGVWVGTATGRCERLDLVTNEWRESTGLPAAPVTDIASDGRDVWAATSAGVGRYNSLKQEWDLWDETSGLPSAVVWALAADADGLWAGSNKGLLRYRQETLGWEQVRGPDDRLGGRIHDLCLAAGSLWIASDAEGLSRIDLAKQEVVTYDLRAEYGVERIDRLVAAPTGEVFIACDRGFLAAQGEGALGPWRLIEQPGWEVTGLAATADAVWAAAGPAGVWKYALASGDWTQYAPADELPPSPLTAVTAQANLGWFGFGEHGLSVYDPTQDRWQRLEPPEGLPRQVRGLATAGNRVYAACADGIVVWDQRFEGWTGYTSQREPNLLGDEWTDVAVSGDSVYFVGPGRLSQFNLDMELEQTYENGELIGSRDGRLPRLTIDDTTGDLWIIGPLMAHRFEPRQRAWGWLSAEFFQPLAGTYHPGEPLILDVACDHESVWFVTRDRVVQYDKQLAQDYHWDAGVHEAFGEPRLVACDRFSVWFATVKGLCRYDRREQTVTLLTWPEGMEGGAPTALALDPEEPCLWVSTERSTARVNFGGGEPSWQPFGPRTGLIDGVRWIRPMREVVWFTSPSGVSVYRRERPRDR